MFEHFTDRARRALLMAQEEARLLNHNFIGTEHMLVGLIHEGEGVAAKALGSIGISLEAVREKVEQRRGPAGMSTSASAPFTPRAKKVLDLSLREALQLGHSYIGTEHILLGLIREPEGVGCASTGQPGCRPVPGAPASDPICCPVTRPPARTSRPRGRPRRGRRWRPAVRYLTSSGATSPSWQGSASSTR